MKVGFFTNQLDNRGTGNAVLDYAHYNETILGNESYIFSMPDGAHNVNMVIKMVNRLGVSHIRYFPELEPVDVIYHIKSGFNDGMEEHLRKFAPKYVVHSVFDNDPHGDVYATISPWMGTRFKLPHVPHIVQKLKPDPIDVSTFRKSLGIPLDAVVFGRLGGFDTFDIDWVFEAIIDDVRKNPSHHYVFVNTETTPSVMNVVTLPEIVTRYEKAVFIHSCDYMLHARARGETFGLSVGEFAVAKKPIITYGLSHEKAHLQELGLSNIENTYINKEDLKEILNKPAPYTYTSGYERYTPANVMQQFREVFL